MKRGVAKSSAEGKHSTKDIKKQQKIDKIRKIIRDQEIFKSVGVYRL